MSDTVHTAEPSLGPAFREAAGLTLPVVAGIPDGLLKAPTPCSEYDVRTLVNHLFHVLVQFRGLAAKEDTGEFGTPPDYVGQGPDWRERFAAAAGELAAAWSAPGAEEGTTGARSMPARVVGSMALLDMCVHGWDLARATGQEYLPGEAMSGVLRTLAGMMARMAPTGRSMGMFAEPVPLPDDGVFGDFERLLAESGRDPRWTPEHAAHS